MFAPFFGRFVARGMRLTLSLLFWFTPVAWPAARARGLAAAQWFSPIGYVVDATRACLIAGAPPPTWAARAVVLVRDGGAGGAGRAGQQPPARAVPGGALTLERIDTLRGEYVALCAGGALTGEAAALIRCAAADGAELIYGDAVQTGADGRARPVFRPAWSPETLLSHNNAGSALVLAAELYARAGADGREDADALYALFHRAAALARRRLPYPARAVLRRAASAVLQLPHRVGRPAPARPQRHGGTGAVHRQL